jgi:pyruvate dehydrogenase E2 component (dihydrolipoyllysine-residue acetyltransferase)
LDDAIWEWEEVSLIYDIVIPALGATGGDVVFEEWRVQPGQFVKAGSTLFVVTTDKATVEVEAFRDGYLRETLISPGATVSIQTVVGHLTDTLEELLSAGLPRDESVEEWIKPTDQLPTAGDGRPRRVLASPLARRMAAELGLDLALIKASGSQGQILKRDIAHSVENTHVEGRVVHVPVSPMRRVIAERTQRSNTEVPHFHGSMVIDMTEAKATLKQAAMRADKNNLVAPTINDLTLRAAALALRQTPALNVSFRGEEVLYFEDIHIGVVIGLPEGMLIPVVRHADQLNLFTLAATTHQLRKAAEAGHLSNSQLSGATFTVSNLGMYGLDSFSAVINPPEAGILALGAVREQSAVWQGNLAVRWQMTATLAVDHRAVDGITMAKFLNEFKHLLEHPLSLSLEAFQEYSK